MQPSGDVGASKNRRTWTRWALAGFLVLAVAVFFLTGLDEYFSLAVVKRNLSAIEARVQANLLLAVLAYFLLYVLVTALSLPAAALLTLVGGALFGVLVGTAVVSVAATVGATLAFLSSRYILGNWVQEHYGQRLAKMNRGIEQEGAYYLFTLRLVPVFPFFVINLAMGLTTIPTRTYIWVTWVGMLPGTAVYANAGSQLASIESLRDIASPAVLASFAALGLLPLVLRKALQLIGGRRQP